MLKVSDMAKAGTDSEKLSTLYAELQRFGEADNFEKAIKTAETILKVDPNETEAYNYLVICLIQLNECQKALDKIQKSKDVSGLVFEKAYCEYRLYKNQEALATLKSAPKLDFRCKELHAQLLYRLEDFEGSLQLYKEVIKNSQDDYDDERQTNVSAVTAALSLSTASPDLATPDLSDDNHDRCYNAACFLIGRGEYLEADAQLKRSEELCREFLEDEDITEEEKEDELATIRVQMAYCAQMLGNTAEAMKMYNLMFKNKSSDIAVTAVAANNIVSLNEDQNVFDSKKKMKLATAPELSKKLTSRQQKSIDVNNCLLAYYSNQGDVCRSSCRSLRQKYPDLDTAELIESSLLVKTKQAAKAVELLQSYISSATDPSVNVQLSLASLYLAQGFTSKVCEVLRQLGHITYKPAIVSLLISLYMSQEDDSSVSDFFSDVISWYERNEENNPALQDILKSAADFQLKAKNPKLAASLLEKLKKLNPGNRAILSMLFAAYSQFDASKAKQVSSELPSVESLAEAIDVDALEESSALLANKYKAKKEDKATAEGSGELLENKKKKKKRKGKLPKEYNPAVDPDPERWLPKRERSTWKGRRRDKRKENIGKGSQGATAAGGPELDITKMETAEQAAQPTPSVSKGYSASKQQQKKKKTKKGKK